MATYQGQSLMSYPDSYGQYYQSTMSSIDPVKRTVGWETTRPPGNGKAPAPPSNYYNHLNSLYESSTPHLEENSEIEYYYDDNSGNTVGPKPVNGEQYPNYSVRKGVEETSQYPDYYEETAGGSPQPVQVNKTVYRQKIGKYPRIEEADEGGNDFYEYHEDGEENHLDHRIRNIRKNEAIFRQDGNDLNTIANYAATAIKMLSLIYSVVGGGGGTSQPQSSDRIDTGLPGTPPANEVDLALGTLMAFGGKYLRQIAMYTWEHATNTPAEPLGAPSSQSAATVSSSAVTASADAVQEPSSQAALPSVGSSGKPYLSTLSPQELETLGLKAVAAGAEPTKLQQAFAAAQLNGDWSQLTSEMSAVLGPEAVGATAGGGVDVLSQASQLIQNFVSNSPLVDKVDNNQPGVSSSSVQTQSQVPSGVGYYVAMAENYANRITKVINGPEPNQLNQNLSEEDQIGQQSVITRFIKEFNLEQEALALQYQANSVIKQVNNMIEGTPDDKIDKVGSAGADDEIVDANGGSTGGIASLISAVPTMLGQVAVSAIRFITPAAPQALEEKVDAGPVNTGGVSYSEIKPTVDMDTVAYATLGMGAIGTVLYGIYAASEGDKKKRSSLYKRSVHEERQKAADLLWASLSKQLVQESGRR